MVILFLLSLSFAIHCTVPALNINDEWITVNQLHQLGIGHQVVVNEGKYGAFLSGENTPYFTVRHNILGYSLALPLISIPVLVIFKSLDLWFRFFVLFVASFSLLLSSIIILRCYPSHSKVYGISFPWILIIIAFAEFILNQVFFTPFLAQEPAPIEVAAAVFTENVIFAFLSITLFLICYTIFSDTWFSLFGSFGLISCSSYIYWATVTKDHLLVVFAFSICLLFFIRYLIHQKIPDAIAAFCTTGLIIWIRPEFGFTLAIALSVFFLIPHLREIIHKPFSWSSWRVVCTPLFILAGSIPFFLNNLLITGNPLTPIFLAYADDIVGESVANADFAMNISPENRGISNSNELLTLIPQELDPVQSILRFFTPQWDTLLQNLVLIFTSPDTGMMGIFGMTPLFLLGVCLLPGMIMVRKNQVPPTMIRIITLSLVLIGVVLITYIRGLPGLIASEGIGPDLRYLTPLYIPAGIIGLSGIFCYSNSSWSNLLKYSLSSAVIGSPLVFLSLLIIQPFGGGFHEYTYTLSMLGIISAGISAGLLLFLKKNEYKKIKHLSISFMILFPLSWQLLTVLLFSITKFNGYPFWLPIIEYLYSAWIIPVG